MMQSGIISKQVSFCIAPERFTSADQFQGRIPDITIECMRYLRKCYPAITVSVEVEKPAREGLQMLAAEADVVFYSKSWAQVNCH